MARFSENIFLQIKKKFLDVWKCRPGFTFEIILLDLCISKQTLNPHSDLLIGYK